MQTTIRDLQLRRGRERRGLALAEGVRLVEEALAAGVPVRGAAVSSTLEGTARGSALKSALLHSGVRLEEVGPAELDALADTEHPQGIVAVVEPPRWKLDHMAGRAGPVLVLDGVQDPGNVGTMLRTALGLGAAGVVALKGTAELTNPKVVRGSMGALFRLPCVASDAEEFLAWARRQGLPIWIAEADGAPLATDRGASNRPAIVVGNEGAGVGDAMAAAADLRLAIPLAEGAESLNVAIAAAILLYEAGRGR